MASTYGGANGLAELLQNFHRTADSSRARVSSAKYEPGSMDFVEQLLHNRAPMAGASSSRTSDSDTGLRGNHISAGLPLSSTEAQQIAASMLQRAGFDSGSSRSKQRSSSVSKQRQLTEVVGQIAQLQPQLPQRSSSMPKIRAVEAQLAGKLDTILTSKGAPPTQEDQGKKRSYHLAGRAEDEPAKSLLFGYAEAASSSGHDARHTGKDQRQHMPYGAGIPGVTGGILAQASHALFQDQPAGLDGVRRAWGDASASVSVAQGYGSGRYGATDPSAVAAGLAAASSSFGPVGSQTAIAVEVIKQSGKESAEDLSLMSGRMGELRQTLRAASGNGSSGGAPAAVARGSSGSGLAAGATTAAQDLSRPQARAPGPAAGGSSNHGRGTGSTASLPIQEWLASQRIAPPPSIPPSIAGTPAAPALPSRRFLAEHQSGASSALQEQLAGIRRSTVTAQLSGSQAIRQRSGLDKHQLGSTATSQSVAAAAGLAAYSGAPALPKPAQEQQVLGSGAEPGLWAGTLLQLERHSGSAGDGPKPGPSQAQVPRYGLNTDAWLRGAAAAAEDVASTSGSSGRAEPGRPPGLGDGTAMHSLLLQQKRNKDMEHRLVADQHAAARDKFASAELKSQYDQVTERCLVQEQEIRALKQQLQRQQAAEKPGAQPCGRCSLAQGELQQARDEASNRAAQLREVTGQLATAQSHIEQLKQVVARAQQDADEQAVSALQQRTEAEHLLVELLQQAASSPESRQAGASAASRSSGALQMYAPSSNGGMLGSVPRDLPGMVSLLREQLIGRQHLVERLAKELEDTKFELKKAVHDKQHVESRHTQQAGFEKERVAGLEEQAEQARTSLAAQQLRLRQMEEDLRKAQRERDEMERAKQEAQAQMREAARQVDLMQQRLYHGKQANEDLKLKDERMKFLQQQLDEAKQLAARADVLSAALEQCKSERDEARAALDKLDKELTNSTKEVKQLQAHLSMLQVERNTALVRTEGAQGKAVEDSATISQLVQENRRALERVQKAEDDQKLALKEAQRYAQELSTAANEREQLRRQLTTLQSQLADLQGQLVQAKDNAPLKDAVYAQHQASGEVTRLREEVLTLSRIRDNLSDHCQKLMWDMKRHGLAVPEMPTGAASTTALAQMKHQLKEEADAREAAEREVTNLRQEVADLRSSANKLQRDWESLSVRYQQLERSQADAESAWKASTERDTEEIAGLKRQMTTLQVQLHQQHMLGDTTANELQAQVAKLHVELDTVQRATSAAEAQVAATSEQLATARAVLADRDAELEGVRQQLVATKLLADKVPELQAQLGAAQQELARLQLSTGERQQKDALKLDELESAVAKMAAEKEKHDADYDALYRYAESVLAQVNAANSDLADMRSAAAAKEQEVADMQARIEELNWEVQDKDKKLAVKPKWSEMQGRINDLTAQLDELSQERDTLNAQVVELDEKLRTETEQHYITDGRRVRLSEEVDRLRGILRMYTIPF